MIDNSNFKSYDINETANPVLTKEGMLKDNNNPSNDQFHLRGYIQESMHVFIQNGLLLANTNHKEIKILEMGFGTGLNAILTYRENMLIQNQIHYTAVEAYPLPASITDKLNYFEFLEKPLQPTFNKMHHSNWFENVFFGNFVLQKIQADMLELNLEGNFDLIYYDAFSPLQQPELWTFEVLHKIYEACNPNAILVTHCTKDEVKQTLEKIGFKVENLEGVNGKKQMIRAIK